MPPIVIYNPCTFYRLIPPCHSAGWDTGDQSASAFLKCSQGFLRVPTTPPQATASPFAIWVTIKHPFLWIEYRADVWHTLGWTQLISTPLQLVEFRRACHPRLPHPYPGSGILMQTTTCTVNRITVKNNSILLQVPLGWGKAPGNNPSPGQSPRGKAVSSPGEPMGPEALPLCRNNNGLSISS